MRQLTILCPLLLLFGYVINVARAEVPPTSMDISFYLEPVTSEKYPQKTAEDVLQTASFTPISGTRIPHYDGTTWVKIAWQSEQSSDWLINHYPSLDHETVFVLQNGRIISTILGGHTRSFDSRTIPYHKLLSPVRNADGVLIRVAHQFVPLMFQLLQPDELAQQRLSEMTWYAAVYAIVVVMFVYNLFIYFYLRASRYFYYCLYLVAMLFTQLRLSGLGKQYLWPNVTDYTPAINIFSTVIVTIAGILFLRAFLDSRHLTPFKHRTLLLTAILCWVTYMFYWLKPIFPVMEMVSVITSQLMLVVSLIVVYAVIISNLLANDRGARVLIVTYTVLNVASFIAVMRHNGLISNSFLVEHIVDIAVVFEAVVLSLALAGRIQQLRQEKITAEVRQRQQQQKFSRQLLSVQEAEKRNIGNALHDNYTHQLLLLKESITQKLGKQSSEAQQITQMLHDMRHFSHIIHPYMLEKLGLKAALNAMIEDIVNTRTLDINTSIDELDLNDEQQILVYRIVQECLNNIIKHADADECLIAIYTGNTTKSGDHEIIIKDDGKGFDPTQSTSSLGLTTLRERVQMLNGKLTFRSTLDCQMEGTTVHIAFPVVPATVTGESI